MAARISRGAVVATLAGNTIEFFDFITYTFFAVYVGKAFFPTDSDFASLLLSVATFGVGFLTRPLGGVLIGGYADRAGRKPALLLTIVLMSIGTFGLVATPSYATIGLAAPLLLVVSRLVQGVALGGEVGAASAVLVEAAPDGKRAMYMSLQTLSQGVATMAAGAVGLTLAQTLEPAALASWGWRVAFGVGLILIPVGLYLRRALPETLTEPTHATASSALRAVLRDHRKELVLVVMASMCLTVNTYVLTYMTTYALTTLKMSPSVAMVAPIVHGAIIIASAPVAGLICERFGRRPTFLVSRALAIAVQVPLFLFLIHDRSLFALIASIVTMTALGAPSTVAGLTTMSEVFPTASRGAGIALAYALTVTIFGATTQFVIAWLIGVTHSPLAPAYYVMGTSAVSMVAMLLMRETR